MRRIHALAVAVGLSILAAPSMAHVGHGTTGIAAGFAHPLLGLDHLLAMLGVGILGVTLGGRAILVLPTSFVVAMIIGAMLGMAGRPLPLVETAIAASLLALGLALALRARLPLLLATVAVGGFALFHGHVHGAEVTDTATGLLYGAGFVTATALLHALGIAAASVVERRGAQSLIRAAGIGVAAVGLMTLLD